ncbi:MAG: metal-dependent transcriptional regulator [Candidatus Omnitrophota bacterium]|nr:MAG: metal-dependent transcriptional regulator [Candidatus Omnitrophota bacterium]
MERLTDKEEEILESLWVEVEESAKTPDIGVLRDEPALEDLIEKGFIDRQKEKLLTEKGLKEAERCVRRHRLAERLLADILYVKDPLIHEASCKFEHGLHHGLEDNICTLLGHPRTCPHGKPIPEGECCKKFEKIPQRLIVSLKELVPGNTGKISYINTQDTQTLKRLISMGILPGNQIKLLHRFPSFVFEMGNSNFAIDKDLAENIYVLLLQTGPFNKKGGKRWRHGLK